MKTNNATTAYFIIEKPRLGAEEYNRIIQKTPRMETHNNLLNRESEKQSTGTSKTANYGDTKSTDGPGDTNDHTTQHPSRQGNPRLRGTRACNIT